MKKTYANHGELTLVLCLFALSLPSCIESNKKRRAAVGDDTVARDASSVEGPADGTGGGRGDVRGAPGSVSPPKGPVQPPIQVVPPDGPITHPFKGIAYGTLSLGTSQEVAQTGLKFARPYWRVFKVAGEAAFFVWPARYGESSELLKICNDSEQPVHPLHPDFKDTRYCKTSSPAASAKLPKAKAHALAKAMNDELRFRSSPFYDGAKQRHRVFPNPHWHEIAEVCAKPLTGAVAPWCSIYSSQKSALEARVLAYFDDAPAAKEMAAAISTLYAIP